MNIGVIGCGNIFEKAYGPGAALYDLELVAIADLNMDRAREMAERFDIPVVCTVDEIFANSEIEVILNLTVPGAHYEIQKRAIEAGKHVYSEKPLDLEPQRMRELIALADSKGLRIGCAPDTFLGQGHQCCRRLLDEGAIGKPISGVAFMMCGGHETWHPSPEFYYEPGGGPVLDMGPYYITAMVNLLGPVKRVCSTAIAGFTERTITSEPKNGTVVPVEVPTQVNGILEFRNGCVVTIIMSFDVKGGHHLPNLELYGQSGSLQMPDPNTFGPPDRNPVTLKNADLDWQQQMPATPIGQRSAGLRDLIDGQNRASGRLAYHVLEVMLALNRGAEAGWQEIAFQCEQPAPYRPYAVKGETAYNPN